LQVSAFLKNYRNPFNTSAVIISQLPLSSQVSLKVYESLGNEIANLENEEKKPPKFINSGGLN
jgi:hypothetical protein